MDEISNKTLATLLIFAIVISLAGTFFAMRGVTQVTSVISGAASSATGTAKVYINETASITLSYNSNAANSIDFGSGFRNSSVVAEESECNLTSSAPKPDCWANTSAYVPSDFTVENDGNIYINITINSTAAASWFDSCNSETSILSGDADAKWWGKNLSTGCTPTDGILNNSNLSFTGTEQLLCTNLSPDDSKDEFNVSMTVFVPAGPAGQCDNDVMFYAYKNY